MIGTWRLSSPSASDCRIRRVHSSPPITGISMSIRMTETSGGLEALFAAQREVVARKERASAPWEATWTVCPSFWSWLRRTFWLIRLSSTTRMEYTGSGELWLARVSCNVESECGALPRLRRNSDLAAVRFDHLAADEQSKAGAPVPGVCSYGCLLEPFEDAQLLLAADPAPRVGDLEV
jgi:hypothetical protein